ncbi:MAG: putative TIM-barrel fold metal-dependent hydrolase [Planctomycetota bacterium]|jgi:predicted TIM-barrel fold metal-dependent hydrolase
MGRIWKSGLALLLALGLAYATLPSWVSTFAGTSDWTALEGRALSAETQKFLDPLLEGLLGHKLLDVHVHLAGRGIGSDCWVNPRMLSRKYPPAWVRFQSYLSAGHLAAEDPDAQFAAGAIRLAEAMPVPGQFHLLAFDYACDNEGAPLPEWSAFHVPDTYAFDVASHAGAGFHPVASIHPARPDALQRLREAKAAGGVLIKWLPSAQNIDPASASCDAFYAEMKRLGLILLVHCGREEAMETGDWGHLANPLRLRRPLESGLRIIVAHCATTGSGADLDFPDRPDQPNFKLWLRLMDEPQYKEQLFGDISTLTQVNHFEHGLVELLERQDLHGRLLNGSDWPLPGINILYQLKPLAKAGLIDPADMDALRELYDFNPLLFDLALKRTLRHPKTTARFLNDIFLTRPDLGL